MNLPSVFAELKRRNVYKVAAAYAVVGWLLVQVATQVFPFFEIPNWAVRFIVLAIIVGFPIALVLAWAFESTPHGIERTEVADAKRQQSHGRVWIYTAVIGAMLSLALFFLGRYTARPTAAEPSASSGKSIAVLPFENLSRDPENAFFADGVQDQILTDLAKLADLKVISRTSVMQYKNTAARDLRQIAQQLGVAHILEGSVQRAGGKVRVNAQLIDARNDTHEWAENYDRPIDDVFAMQSEIAQTIAEQLQAKISPREKAAMSEVPTTDLAAHNLYLRARELSAPGPNDPNGKRDLLEGVRLVNDAIARDPNFFRAYILLAKLQDDIFWAGFDHTPERLALVNAAIQSAARLQPEAGELHVARAGYAYHAYRDYNRARAELETARKTLPNDAELYYLAALIDRRQARWDDALRNFDRAIELDPRNFLRLDEAGQLNIGLRRFREAKQLLERARDIRPDYYFVRSQLAALPFLERADIRPFLELTNGTTPGQPKWTEESAADLLLCALVQHDRGMASRALAAMAAEGYQDTNSNLLVPRGWYVGLAARTFADKTGGQAAFTAARVPLEKIVREQPDYAEAWTFLGLVDAGLGRNEDAIRERRRACELLPLSADALAGAFFIQNLAQIYAWIGEKDLALQQLGTAAIVPFGINYGELKLEPQ